MEWKLVMFLFHATTLSVAMATEGFVLTGPKHLLEDSVEMFCISLEGAVKQPLCTLDLLGVESDTVYASSQLQIKGRNFLPCRT